MKSWKFSLLTLIAISAILLFGFSVRKIGEPKKKTTPFVPPKGCVFRTVMGEESSELNSIYKTPEKVQLSVDRGLSWIIRAQNQNGGWGAGSHAPGYYRSTRRCSRSGYNSDGINGDVAQWNDINKRGILRPIAKSTRLPNESHGKFSSRAITSPTKQVRKFKRS